MFYLFFYEGNDIMFISLVRLENTLIVLIINNCLIQYLLTKENELAPVCLVQKPIISNSKEVHSLVWKGEACLGI